jgi:hypothetical protein
VSCIGCITSSLSCFTAIFTVCVKPDPTSLGENDKPEELPRPGKELTILISLFSIVPIEIYLFYAINGFTVAVILTIFNFLKQTSDTEIVKKNLEVGIYMFGYLGLLILLTLLLYKELQSHLLSTFYIAQAESETAE